MPVEINVSEISQASGYLYNWDCVVRQVLCGKKTPEEEASVNPGVGRVSFGEKVTPEQEASECQTCGQADCAEEKRPKKRM